MAMSATAFFGHFKKLNQYLNANPDASDELKARTREMASAFRACYTAEAFRDALSKDEPVQSEVEDRTTSALMAFTKERATRGA